MKHGSGKMQFTGTQVTYEGEFKDDLKQCKCSKYFFGNSYGWLSDGQLDENEQITGKGTFEFPL